MISTGLTVQSGLDGENEEITIRLLELIDQQLFDTSSENLIGADVSLVKSNCKAAGALFGTHCAELIGKLTKLLCFLTGLLATGCTHARHHQAREENCRVH